MNRRRASEALPPLTRRVLLRMVGAFVVIAAIHVTVGLLTSSYWMGLIAVGVVCMLLSAISTVARPSRRR